jgi:hypothetical protein
MEILEKGAVNFPVFLKIRVPKIKLGNQKIARPIFQINIFPQ